VAAVTQPVSFLLVAMLMIGVTHALRAARLQADEHAQLAETARTAAEELSAERGRFLHTLSHEVRTPINAVMGYADLLASGIGGHLNGTQGEYVTRLRSAAQHLASVANGVLDIARSDAGYQSLARRRERLAVSVESALVLVTPQARAKNVAIRLRPSDDSLAYLGDRHAVQRILVNLLGNAVKFTPSGGSVTIESSATVTRDRSSASVARAISVCVLDSGPGVAKSDQVRIFEAFERATPSGTAGRVEGTGLGLTISRHLARQMGGDITAESVLGDGACFILCLPAADSVI
jgi:signal transduction histidine kinase